MTDWTCREQVFGISLRRPLQVNGLFPETTATEEREKEGRKRFLGTDRHLDRVGTMVC